jgi:hypothetical protein
MSSAKPTVDDDEDDTTVSHNDEEKSQSNDDTDSNASSEYEVVRNIDLMCKTSFMDQLCIHECCLTFLGENSIETSSTSRWIRVLH